METNTEIRDSRTGSDRRIATNAVLLTISKIVSRVSFIVLFVLLSYLIGKEEYGSFRQVWMINKSLAEIFAFGVPISIYFFLPRLMKGEKKIFVMQSILILSVLGCALSALIFLLAAPIGSFFGNPALSPYLRLFALFPLLYMPALALESVLVSMDRTVPFSVFTLIDRALFLAIVAATVFLFRTVEGVFIVMLAFAAFELLALLAMTAYYLHGLEMSRGNLKIGKQMRFAIPSGISNIVDVLNQEIDKIMIAVSFSVSRFAVYANGGFEIPIIGTMAASVTSVLMPEYAKRHEQGDLHGILRLWHGAICRVGILLIPIMIFCLYFSSEIITLLFSDKYLDSTLIFQIYLLATLPKVTWYASVLVAMGYSREPLYGSIISLSSNALLNIILIQLIGFPGPAIATVAASYIVAFYFLNRIRTSTSVGWNEVFPWGRLLKMLFVSGGLCVVFLPLAVWQNLSNAGKVAVALPIYGATVYYAFRRLTLITDEDSAFIFGILSKVRHRLAGAA